MQMAVDIAFDSLNPSLKNEFTYRDIGIVNEIRDPSHLLQNSVLILPMHRSIYGRP